MPGNVGEVSIKGDIVLYPLVPIEPPNIDLVATIIFDLQRAGVFPKKVKDYRERMFRKASMKTIIEHVKNRGRLVYSRFVKGQGWVNLVYTHYDMPIKTL